MTIRVILNVYSSFPLFLLFISHEDKKNFSLELEGLKEGLLFSKIGGGEVVEKSGKNRL